MAEIPEMLLTVEDLEQPTFSKEDIEREDDGSDTMSLAQAKARQERAQHPRSILPQSSPNQCLCSVYFEDKDKLILHQIQYCTNEWAKEQCTSYLMLAEDHKAVANFYHRCKHHIQTYAREAVDKNRVKTKENRDRTSEQLRQANHKFFETLDKWSRNPNLTAQIQTRIVRTRIDQCVRI